MRESTFAFGDDGGLVGTLCQPESTAAAQGLVMFNAGVVHRVGPHRIHVKLAREMAAQGVASIRFDLHGMGDSRRSTESSSHAEQVVGDLRQAMDELQRAANVQRIALLGFCSGVPQSWDAALADERVSLVILYDGMHLPTRRARLRFLLLRLRAHGFGFRAMRLWVRRGVEAVGALLARQRGDSRRAHAEGHAAIGEAFSKLRRLRERGVEVVVLNSGADYSVFNYPEQAGESVGARAPGLRFGFLDAADHVLTSRQAQRDYVEWMRELLLRGSVEGAPNSRPAGGATDASFHAPYVPGRKSHDAGDARP